MLLTNQDKIVNTNGPTQKKEYFTSPCAARSLKYPSEFDMTMLQENIN